MLQPGVIAFIRRRELLRPGDRVAAAVSGGADSVALLRLLLELRAELGIVPAVAHLHHGMRGAEADADAAFVADLAARHDLELVSERADVPAYAAEQGLSPEAAARTLRYGFFTRVLRERGFDRVATGHTRDDQAETVLLRLIRGTGMRGLAGIHPLVWVNPPGGAAGATQAALRDAVMLHPPGDAPGATAASQRDMAIVRPLLEVRRRELEQYLRGLGQSWREDASNRDLRHARNRIRHELLPLLERDYNPAIADLLAETAEIARAEEEDWAREVERHAARVLLPEAQAEARSVLLLHALAKQPLAMQRRLVRLAAERLGTRLASSQVEAVLRLLEEDGPRAAELPGGWAASRAGVELVLQRPPARAAMAEKDGGYSFPLPIPGEVRIPGLGTTVRASLVPLGGQEGGYNPAQLLDRALLAAELTVRNWHPGDRYWPPHTRSPKKVKELLQQRERDARRRRLWPVVVSGEALVWMRGFPPPERLRPAAPGGLGVLIEELPS